jgi:hypothetical protein
MTMTAHESPELGSGVTAIALRDVGGNRDRSAAELIGQGEFFVGGQAFREPMNLLHEVQRAAPHVQIAEVPDLAHAVIWSRANAGA